MSMDTGSEDRWYNGEPAPVQYSSDGVGLGAEERWYNGEPAPLQYQETSPLTGGTAANLFAASATPSIITTTSGTARNLFAASAQPGAIRTTSGQAENLFAAEALLWQLAFTYDQVGNLTSVTDPDGGLTEYTYDALRRMTSVTNPWSETTYYTYSPGGRMTSRVLGNGCVTYFSYAQGQVSKVENLKADLSPISTFDYARDVVGNPLSIVREDGGVTYYDYDKKYQLISETQVAPGGATLYAWTWDYDPAGNRLEQTYNGDTTYYAYNAANELLTETTGAATTYYAYDHRGNQTVKADEEGTTYFEYNPQNLLITITLPDETENTFGYDGDSKRVYANDSQGARRMIYQGPDMLKLLQEQDAYGTVVQYTIGIGLESMRRRD
jgi:YD repeat-containing protein